MPMSALKSPKPSQQPVQEASASIMARAHQAPRCQHIKFDGLRCQSPALRGKRLCYFHGRIHYPRPRRTLLPLLEDANSVQAVLLSVQRALLEGTVDRDTAHLLLYALDIARANLKNVDFEPLAFPGLKPTQNPALYAGLPRLRSGQVPPRSSTEAATDPEVPCALSPGAGVPTRPPLALWGGGGATESSPGRESRESPQTSPIPLAAAKRQTPGFSRGASLASGPRAGRRPERA